MKNLTTLFLLSILASSCQTAQEQTKEVSYSEPAAIYFKKELRPFYHGVASGDPLLDRVIIWTRITPDDAAKEVKVGWEVSRSADFAIIEKTGKYSTSPAKDYTVKVDVDELEPGTVYFYRFKALGVTSGVGRTKTAAVSADSLRFAVVSCSNYEWGFFNAYGKIAEREVLDAVIHLGDYIYEYAPGVYGDTTIGRKHLPAKELISLSDYRTRYSQYRLDPDLNAVHSKHPFIAIWDDHEIADDTYKEGAQNHQDDEGSFDQRKNAAVQAYYEWMPVRESNELYRTFNFGNLADLIMLDERLEGRSKQPSSLNDPAYVSEESTMLGGAQLAWLKQQLDQSNSKWKIVGNQVIFSDLEQGAIFPDRPQNLDSWSGYPKERKEIAEFLNDRNIKNVVFITGDTHSSWAFETVIKDTSTDPLAVEFGTTSITSANFDEYTPPDSAHMAEERYLSSNSHLKYTNVLDHGYLLLTLKDEEATAQFFFVKTLRKPKTDENMAKEFTVKAGQSTIY